MDRNYDTAENYEFEKMTRKVFDRKIAITECDEKLKNQARIVRGDKTAFTMIYDTVSFVALSLSTELGELNEGKLG